jgi:diguanylate cyclase (GGDEF)-like protein
MGGTSGFLAVLWRRPHHITAALVAEIRGLAEVLSDAVDVSSMARDAMTGLPDRQALLDRLRVASEASRASGLPPTVLFMDVDGLKRVNDQFGHAAGDALLCAVARRLAATTRPADTLARLGGDEFALVCPDLPRETVPAQIAARLARVTQEPVSVVGQQIPVRISIGVATGPFPDATDALRWADTAMYRAKQDGGGICVYDATLHAETRWQVHVQRALPAAMRRGQLFLVYQPQVRLASTRVAGVEALVRWQHPHAGLLLPPRFLPMAEQGGYAETIGRWVLERACTEIVQRGSDSRSGGARICRRLHLSVNVSPRQLAVSSLPDLVGDVLAGSGLDPQRLTLEVTETALVEDPEAVRQQLDQIVRLGVRVALDDFGTGYSSLTLLRNLPVQQLKIDRSFITDLPTNARDQQVVAALTRLSHKLGARCCAEGVETPDQLAAVRTTGCDEVQGFLLGRPQPLDEICTKLASTVGLLTEETTT